MNITYQLKCIFHLKEPEEANALAICKVPVIGFPDDGPIHKDIPTELFALSTCVRFPTGWGFVWLSDREKELAMATLEANQAVINTWYWVRFVRNITTEPLDE